MTHISIGARTPGGCASLGGPPAGAPATKNILAAPPSLAAGGPAPGTTRLGHDKRFVSPRQRDHCRGLLGRPCRFSLFTLRRSWHFILWGLAQLEWRGSARCCARIGNGGGACAPPRSDCAVPKAWKAGTPRRHVHQSEEGPLRLGALSPQAEPAGAGATNTGNPGANSVRRAHVRC